MSSIDDQLYKKRILIKLLGKVSYARKLGVKIGENCRIYISYWGTEPELISVGNNVTITSDVTLLTHDGSTCLIKMIMMIDIISFVK